MRALTSQVNLKGCFLIGNGPSLNAVDVSVLRFYQTIAFNRAYIAFDQWGFVPDYYACFDSLVIADNFEEIKIMLAKSSATKFFFSDSARNYGIAPSPNVAFVTLHSSDLYTVGIDRISDLGNVAASSLQILAALGFERVVLVGVDGRYAPSRGRPSGEPGIVRLETDVDHFCPQYGSGKLRRENPDMKRILGAWKHAARGCGEFGLDVRNASPGSAIGVFPTLSFTDALQWIPRKKAN